MKDVLVCNIFFSVFKDWIWLSVFYYLWGVLNIHGIFIFLAYKSQDEYSTWDLWICVFQETQDLLGIRMANTACFIIVGRNDIPIYEAEVGSAAKVHFLLHFLYFYTCNRNNESVLFKFLLYSFAQIFASMFPIFNMIHTNIFQLLLLDFGCLVTVFTLWNCNRRGPYIIYLPWNGNIQFDCLFRWWSRKMNIQERFTLF